LNQPDNSEKLYPEGYEPNITIKEESNTRNQLLNEILKPSPVTESVDTDLFTVMAKRR